MYKQNGQRETDITKAVDAAMEASISYYDALAGASAMHQGPVYAQACNAYAKVQQAHRAFLDSLNVEAPRVVEHVARRTKAKGLSGRNVKSKTAQGRAASEAEALRRRVARAKKVLDSANLNPVGCGEF